MPARKQRAPLDKRIPEATTVYTTDTDTDELVGKAVRGARQPPRHGDGYAAQHGGGRGRSVDSGEYGYSAQPPTHRISLASRR